MKTFLVYSKKSQNLISNLQDISSLKFVKHGFNLFYILDFFNIFYSIKRGFLVITALLVAFYVFFQNNSLLQAIMVLAVGILASSMESWFLKTRKYKLIATIEAKNQKQAKEQFLQRYIYKQ